MMLQHSPVHLAPIIMVLSGILDNPDCVDSHVYRRCPGFGRWPIDTLHRHHGDFGGAFRPFFTPSRYGGIALGDIFQELLGVDLKKVTDSPGNQIDVPRHEVVETERELKLYVELPGCKKQDVDVTISEQAGVKILKIRAERLVDRELPSAVREDGRANSPKESPPSKRAFEVSFTIGDGIDASSTRGALEDGVLTLVLPKVPPQPPAETIEVPIDPPMSSATGSERNGASGRGGNAGGQGESSEATRNTHISLL